ncbi:MAG: type II toxin-antitoxin system VapC family toxin [Cyanobium sp.]
MSAAETRDWVVDASVAFGWFAAVAHSERAVALLEAQPAVQLLAPDLVLVELLNAGWKAQRQGAISEAQFLAIGELAPTLFSELVPAATLLVTAQRWCLQLDHPAYECIYLALAELRSAVLLTQDQRLLRKLQEVPQAAGLAMAINELVLAG